MLKTVPIQNNKFFQTSEFSRKAVKSGEKSKKFQNGKN